MSTLKLQEKLDEVNPKVNILKECISISNQINDLVDIRLPYLKSRLEAMLANGKAIDIISVEAEAEIQTHITKVEKTLAVEVDKLEEVISKEISISK